MTSRALLAPRVVRVSVRTRSREILRDEAAAELRVWANRVLDRVKDGQEVEARLIERCLAITGDNTRGGRLM